MTSDGTRSREEAGTEARSPGAIHFAAHVDARAEIGSGVSIGPNTLVGPNVTIGDGTSVGANCLIEGWTKIGPACRIHHCVVIGSEPQDVKYKGEETYVRIGRENIIRGWIMQPYPPKQARESVSPNRSGTHCRQPVTHQTLTQANAASWENHTCQWSKAQNPAAHRPRSECGRGQLRFAPAASATLGGYCTPVDRQAGPALPRRRIDA